MSANKEEEVASESSYLEKADNESGNGSHENEVGFIKEKVSSAAHHPASAYHSIAND